nr:hypothetical protein [Tanacetum cinerariifolium]
METEHELSYETLTRVYLGSYEHYKSVGSGVEPFEPGFKFDDQEWVEIRTFSFDLLDQRIDSRNGLQRRKWGMSKNEGCSPLFIVLKTLDGQGNFMDKLEQGADEELSDGGSLRVIVYRYDGLPMLPVAPPSPDYDEHVLLNEDQLLPHVVLPTTESPEYVAESDPEEDPEEYEDDETKDGPVHYPMDMGDYKDDNEGDSSGDDANDKEEEEYLAPADCAVVIPTDELVSSPKGTEPATISFPPEAEVERLLAMPTQSPSPLASLPLPSVGERLARCMALAASPLLLPLHMPPPVDYRDDIPETEMPPCKRFCLSTLGSRYERVDLLMEDRIAHQETIQIVEEEAYAAREAWVHSIGLSQAVHSELQAQQEQVYRVLAPNTPDTATVAKYSHSNTSPVT